jgi:5'-nucleotidase
MLDMELMDDTAMKFLLTNDDGYYAKGIQVLADALTKIGDVTIVAPDRDQSGVSQSLTLRYPIRMRNLGGQHYQIEGTPTDCVHVALSNLLPEPPDWVISGINIGANLGDDVFYSGTVSAAIEGYLAGVNAFAVSLAGETHFESAAHYVVEYLKRWQDHPPYDRQCLWSMNVPDLPLDHIQGIRATRLGQRIEKPKAFPAKDPRGLEAFWCAKHIDPPRDAVEEDSDFKAIYDHYVSLTPLRLDLTDTIKQAKLQTWIEQ